MQVLEIGAGESLPHSPFLGAPWLSRFLAQEFPKELRIIATDISRKVKVFSVDEHGELAFFTTKVDPNDIHNLVSEPTINDDKLKFQSFTTQEIIERIENQTRQLGHKDDWDYLKREHFDVVKDRRWYIRPNLDAAYEKHFFGLEVCYNIDMTALQNTNINDANNFDVIFGRFLLYPSEHSETKKVKDSAETRLTGDGYGLLHFDKGGSCPVLTQQFGTSIARPN